MSKIAQQHTSLADQRKAAAFVDSLRAHAKKEGSFDSATAEEFISTAENQGGNGAVEVPERLQAIFDDANGRDGAKARIAKSLLAGCDEYERRHGKPAGGDVIANALQVGYSMTAAGKKDFGMKLDSATDQHHDQLSLQPGAPAIGVLTAIAMAMPFAGYAAANQSNEGRIIIINHIAQNKVGTYDVGASLDGTASGEPFMSSSRVLKLVPGAAMNGNFRVGMLDDETPDPASAAAAVLRGRSILYVNGLQVGGEVSADGAGNSVVVGKANIAGTDYVLGGTVTPDTGAFALTSAPALPGTADVHFEAFIDYEKAGQEQFAARLGVKGTTFKFYANPDRGIITASPDAQTQFEAETGFTALTLGSEIARLQFYNERHYRALRKLYRIAKNNGNVGNFDFSWSTFGQQKTRAQIWQDFGAVLFAVSQQMALDTIDHGVTHLYVPKYIATQMNTLPTEIFQPSGLTAGAGIWRVGRLFGTFEVYYCPKVVQEAEDGSTGEILCLGTSPTTARNPIIVGDAVAPTFTARGQFDDMKAGYNFYSRGFTSVNPHIPSALGAALINVQNLF